MAPGPPPAHGLKRLHVDSELLSESLDSQRAGIGDAVRSELCDLLLRQNSSAVALARRVLMLFHL